MFGSDFSAACWLGGIHVCNTYALNGEPVGATYIEFPNHPFVDVPNSHWLVDDGKTTIDGFFIDG